MMTIIFGSHLVSNPRFLVRRNKMYRRINSYTLNDREQVWNLLLGCFQEGVQFSPKEEIRYRVEFNKSCNLFM